MAPQAAPRGAGPKSHASWKKSPPTGFEGSYSSEGPGPHRARADRHRDDYSAARPSLACTGVASVVVCLSRAEPPPVLARGHACVEPEGLREVALVREAGGQGGLGQRGVDRGEPLAREFDTQPAEV